MHKTAARPGVFQTLIIQKAVMAITGLMMVGWLTAHMIGNMQLFAGPEIINEYGEWLQNAEWIWPARLVMLCAIALHIWSAVSLTLTSRAARATAYAGGRKSPASSLASKTMKYGGILLLWFLAFHLADLTLGAGPASSSFAAGDVYSNVIASLSRPAVALFYILANLALGLHLQHGISSAIQSIGGTNRLLQRWRGTLAMAVAVLIAGGNILIAIGCVLGVPAMIHGS